MDDRLLRVKKLYHFTDKRNFAQIRDLDGVWSTAKLREMDIEFFPGGNDLSLELDQKFGMDQFVHLCWDYGHPMAYYVRQRDKNIKLFYLQIAPEILDVPGALFSPGVANAVGMPTYSVQEAVDGNMIDHDALERKIGSFMIRENQERRQIAEKSEILVPDHVPLSFILNLPEENNG